MANYMRKGEWLIRANAQNLLYLSIVATQHKRIQRRVLITGKVRMRIRRVLIMGKTRKFDDAQGVQFGRLYKYR